MSHHPARPPFYVTETPAGTGVGFAAGTALTDDHVEALARRLTALAGGLGHPPVTLDLGGVNALSSAALGKLVALHRAVRAGGGRVTLTNLTPAVRRTLRVTRLDAILDIRAAEPALV